MAFDPSRFIQAEADRGDGLATLADASESFAWPQPQPKPAEIRRSEAPTPETLATLATLAGGGWKTSYSWDDDLRAFIAQPCPERMSPTKWDEITGETLAVRERWADVAIERGWSALDLFGCHTDPFARRVDRDGLVAGITGLLTPVSITEITPDYAELRVFRGPPLRHYRMQRPGQVYLWQAYRATTGP